MRRITFLLLSAVAIAACNNANQTSDKAEGSASSSNNSNIRNGISVKSQGLKVEQAFLLFEDGKLVPAGNKVEVGQKVIMKLILNGWKPVNGKVAIGASEKITTDDGQTVLDEDDLFANYTDGIDAKAASGITLSAVITGVDKLYKYFEVSFKVWDKNSSDNVTGSYRLHLK
jgi:hypothetical protein